MLDTTLFYSHEELKEMYKKDYDPFMGNWLFSFADVTDQVLLDFNGRAINTYIDQDKNRWIIFYEQD